MNPAQRQHVRHKAKIRKHFNERDEKFRKVSANSKKEQKRRLAKRTPEEEFSFPFPCVTQPTARLAKALGYDGQTRQYLLFFDGVPSLEQNELLCNWNLVQPAEGSEVISCPEQHQLQAWVLDHLGVYISLDLDPQGCFCARLVAAGTGELLSDWSEPADSHELALEDALYLTLVSHLP